MAASPTTCPANEVLEAIALGRSAAPELQSHVASCLLCQQALQKLRDDNQFLRGFLTSLATPRASASTNQPIEVPGYQIVREIHRGGQGVVYQATQLATRRDVAIKVMREGPFAIKADRARFEREIDILVKLDHPNIVAIHDAGEVGGFHYFVMNYIAGKPFDEAVRAIAVAPAAPGAAATPAPDRLTSSARRTHIAARRGWLEVFIRACEAVHAAHLRGVIHRDLKPSNIYVDAKGEPHVLDFGIAKAADSESLSAMTQTGQFVGSLPWASPEQVEGTSAKIDLRTDVYSLGAILYQLLAGVLPFDVGSNLRSAVDEILYKEPLRPSALATRNGQLSVDDELDTVVMKCLAKDPARRYQSAGELARDLRRYLSGEPIEAKRDSAMYVLRKTMHRYRVRVVVASIVVIVLSAFATLMSVLYQRSSHLEDLASRSAESLSVLLTRSNIERGRMAAMLGNVEQAEQLLWRELLLKRSAPDAPVALLNAPPGPPEAHWALWELYRKFPCLRNLTLGTGRAATLSAAPQPPGVWLIDTSGDARLLTENGDELDAFQVQSSVDWGLPSIDSHGRTVIRFDAREYVLWRRSEPSGAPRRFVLAAAAKPRPDTWQISTSGRYAALVLDRAVQVWDADDPLSAKRFGDVGSPLFAPAISNDDRLVAARDESGAIHIWEIETGRLVASAASDYSPTGVIVRDFGPMLFSPDNTRLADGWAEVAGRIWNLTATPPTSVALAERAGDYRAMCFSPDGRKLAIGDFGGALRIFDTESGARDSLLIAHHGRITGLAYAPDGQQIWTCGSDGDLRLWEVELDAALAESRIEGEAFHAVEFGPKGRSLFAAGGQGSVRRFERDGRVIENRVFGNTATISSVAVSPDGRQLAIATYGKTAFVWRELESNEPPVRVDHPGLVSFVCFSPDGSLLATSCDDRAVRLWRVADLGLERELTGVGDRMPQLAFDPTGQRLAIAVRDGSLLVWDLAEPTPQLWDRTFGKPLRAVRFTGDGRWLLAAGADRAIGIWDTTAHQRVASLTGHNQEVFAIDVSRNGELIASGDTSGVVRLWHLGLRQPLATFEGHSNSVMSVRFAPDDTALATASLDGAIRIWDLTYYNRHIAGSLNNQLRRLGADELDARTAALWREWAAGILGTP